MTETEWVDLDYTLSGRSTARNYKVRKSTLNDICMWWVKDVGMLTPKQHNHIKRAMALAIFEQEVLDKIKEAS